MPFDVYRLANLAGVLGAMADDFTGHPSDALTMVRHHGDQREDVDVVPADPGVGCAGHPFRDDRHPRRGHHG